MLGAPNTSQAGADASTHASGERQQVVVEVTLIEQRGSLREPDVKSQGERTGEPLVMLTQQFIGCIEVPGQPYLVRIAGLVPAGKPRRCWQS